jgi:aerobic-type carbon monoxide dehydrogenase small subunit (CoxS/CutS family)
MHMEETMLRLSVNGESRELDLDPATPLLWALRDGLRLTGTKYSCGIAECGACLVLVDGKPVRSCVTPVSSVLNKQITTIEGLSADRSHPVQQAWIEEEVPQCGYCQSGQILAATALLREHPDPSEADIDEAMQGILCRCGTYPRIRKAIKRAAQLAAESVKEV